LPAENDVQGHQSLLAIQKVIHSGPFAIMDGTTAGNGPGPRTLYPLVKNVVLAVSRPAVMM